LAANRADRTAVFPGENRDNQYFIKDQLRFTDLETFIGQGLSNDNFYFDKTPADFGLKTYYYKIRDCPIIIKCLHHNYYNFEP